MLRSHPCWFHCLLGLIGLVLCHMRRYIESEHGRVLSCTPYALMRYCLSLITGELSPCRVCLSCKGAGFHNSMAELFNKEGDDEEDQELQVMQDEQEDEDGPSSNHTLKLASANVVIKSEILCLAFSDDGR